MLKGIIKKRYSGIRVDNGEKVEGQIYVMGDKILISSRLADKDMVCWGGLGSYKAHFSEIVRESLNEVSELVPCDEIKTKLTKDILIKYGFDFDYKDGYCGIVVHPKGGMIYDVAFEMEERDGFITLSWHVKHGRLPLTKEINNLGDLKEFMFVMFEKQLVNNTNQTGEFIR